MPETSFLIDDYRRGWAFRCLREANADFQMAEKTGVQMVAVSLAILAMRKAQTAIYYALGDPIFLNAVVHQIEPTKAPVEDHTLRLLTRIEHFISVRSEMPESLSKEMALKEARYLIELASELVEFLTSHKVDRLA
ncbi:hypothetical protein KEJ26_06940 [Candidatus Bathyarchaeota archaeon]|nr:hypothetical protein [Candidatus Bathyarchaeota archaeon]